MSTHTQPIAGTTSRLPEQIAGLSDIADRYELFIVDLWGVVHNGVAPFPGVVDCLSELQDAGKRVCLLTNAPRRSTSNVVRLEGLGVPRHCYTKLVSSGEAAHRALRDRPDAFHRGLGRRCFHHGPIRDCDVHHGLDLDMVDVPEAASFILNTGIDEPTETLEQHWPTLARALALELPMLCVNPDLVVVIGDRQAICAGALAAAYAEKGGTVGYHGKPHSAIYELALEELGHSAGERVLCIGDAFHTDITGAARAGLDSLLVTSGIHAKELAQGSPAEFAGLIERYGVEPNFAANSLTW